MAKKISHLFHWHLMDKKIIGNSLREFADNGVRSFVFCSKLAKRILSTEPELEAHLWDLCKSMDVEFVAMHGQCGRYHDLNIPDEEERKAMIRDHIRAMELAVKFGSKTYTVHVGAMFHCTFHMDLPTLRILAHRTLEALIPEAERLGIVLAVENSFEPPNAAHEVVDLVKPFLSSKAVGYCYDSGHANCMRTAPGKKIGEYTDYFRKAWWETGIIQEDNALSQFRDRVVNYEDVIGHNNWPNDKSVSADSFVGRMRARTGLSTFNLQTEAQWENISRCGTKTTVSAGPTTARYEINQG